MRKLSALLISTTLLGACAQGAGYDANQKTYQGATIGAIGGAVIGAISGGGERGKGAVIGGAIGALAGGGIGQYMDRQQQALETATAGTGIDVTRQGNDLFLNLPSSVTFATNSSAISPSFAPALIDVAAVLRDYPETIVEIIGHTDDTGADDYNMALSERRAASVAGSLVNRGVSQRVITSGLGESAPVASNATAEGRAQNRRVEVKIAPIAG